MREGDVEVQASTKEFKGPSFKRVLVAVDGSKNSERASQIAVEVAGSFGSELIVLHIVPRVSHAFVPVRSSALFREYYSEEKKAAQKWIDRVMSRARAKSVKARAETRVAPSVAEEIVHYADRNKVDLVVVGTRGLGAFEKLLVGSVSSGVIAHAHCSVLMVR